MKYYIIAHSNQEKVLIGEAVEGQPFSLEMRPDLGINTEALWLECLGEGAIQDRNGNEISVQEMTEIITG